VLSLFVSWVVAGRVLGVRWGAGAGRGEPPFKGDRFEDVEPFVTQGNAPPNIAILGNLHVPHSPKKKEGDAKRVNPKGGKQKPVY
jgi:hypothetical protein